MNKNANSNVLDSYHLTLADGSIAKVRIYVVGCFPDGTNIRYSICCRIDCKNKHHTLEGLQNSVNPKIIEPAPFKTPDEAKDWLTRNNTQVKAYIIKHIEDHM